MLVLVFAVSLASAYVVRSQFQQNRGVASSSKSLSPVVSATPGKGASTATNKDHSLKTNAVAGATVKQSAPTNAVIKASSSEAAPAVTAAPANMVFPGSKSAAVFDLHPAAGGPAQKQIAAASGTNSKAMKH